MQNSSNLCTLKRAHHGHPTLTKECVCAFFKHPTSSELITGGVDDVPIEPVKGIKIRRVDRKSIHKEAEGIIILHAFTTPLLDRKLEFVSGDMKLLQCLCTSISSP